MVPESAIATIRVIDLAKEMGVSRQGIGDAIRRAGLTPTVIRNKGVPTFLVSPEQAATVKKTMSRSPIARRQPVESFIGRTYEQLTVVAFSPRFVHGKTVRAFDCLCSCGKPTNAILSHLRSGAKPSCGCLFALPSGEGARNRTIRTYRKNAAKRHLLFELTDKNVIALFEGRCEYCGLEPGNVCVVKGGNGSYTYSGIDRVNNKVGYVEENCVSCCTDCNLMKRGFSRERFLLLADRIASHLAKGGPDIQVGQPVIINRKRGRKLPYGEGARNVALLRYRVNAATSGMAFNLTAIEAFGLFARPCFYCGLPPSNIARPKGGNGPYRYSGIDRVDNLLGYTKENCVPCCRDCNFAKRGFLQSRFILAINRIANHQRRTYVENVES